MSATAREWLALFPGGPWSDGKYPLPIHSVSFATLAEASAPRDAQHSTDQWTHGDLARRHD